MIASICISVVVSTFVSMLFLLLSDVLKGPYWVFLPISIFLICMVAGLILGFWVL